VPRSERLYEYHITREGVFYSVITGKLKSKTIPPTSNHDRVNVQYNDTNKQIAVRVDYRMLLLSFYHGHYSSADLLLDVNYYDRHLHNYYINNLMPIFSITEKQRFMMWCLQEITDKEFRVVISESGYQRYPTQLI
jgi:exopolyphosphatase/pppGpp-phosphohydrolase